MRVLVLAALAAMLGVARAQTEGAPPPPTAAQEQALTPEQQAEFAEGEANRARIATRPHWVSDNEAEYPESERALGHHGQAVVRGLLGVDGRLRYATIETSSFAPVLDQSALAAASAATFEPAKDASGAPIPVVMTVPVGFYSYTSSEGVGAAMYTCRQFVLDMDWWRSTGRPFSDHQFYLMIRGLGALARGMTNLESNESYERRWTRAIETCRAHPDRRFAQAINPEGEMIDRMQRNHQSRNR